MLSVAPEPEPRILTYYDDFESLPSAPAILPDDSDVLPGDDADFEEDFEEDDIPW